MPFDGDMTAGCGFIKLETEEKAKFAAALLNGHALDKKHTFAAAQFNDFEKIMQISDEFDMPNSASLIDLKSYILDTKQEQYLF